MNKGIWYGIGAYVAWGLFPIYWKWLHNIPAVQLISHRVLWSFLMLLVFILVSRQWNVFRTALLAPRVLRIYLVAAALIGSNWLIYIWAVNAGLIVQVSLGYYINPLLNVLLGVLFLRERLRSLQWIPLGLAAVGVLYLTFAYGSLPWIALTLALTFGAYGLVKKTAPLGSLHGLTLETGLLFLPALLYLLYSETSGQGAFLHTGAMLIKHSDAKERTRIKLAWCAAARTAASCWTISRQSRSSSNIFWTPRTWPSSRRSRLPMSSFASTDIFIRFPREPPAPTIRSLNQPARTTLQATSHPTLCSPAFQTATRIFWRAWPRTWDIRPRQSWSKA